MKKINNVITFVLFVTFSGAVLADNTRIEKSKISNMSVTTNSMNASIGRDSTALTGSVSIRNGAYVQDSTIVGAAVTTNSMNASIGRGSTAATGSIDIR